MDSLHLGDFKMGWQAGSFYRIKNKEEKQRISDWLGPYVQLVWVFGVRRNKEISVEPRGGLAFGDWLTG